MKHIVMMGLLVSTQQLAFAAESPAEAGLRAETAGRWEDASSIYRQALTTNPDQADLWLRLSDIHARLQQADLAAKALEQAVRLNPKDGKLWMKRAQAQSTAGDAAGAFASAGKALELEPDNIEFWRARAELAVWINNQPAAMEAYKQIITLVPDDANAALGIARQNAWSGHTDAAVAAYKKYLKARPDDQKVWLELARTEGWRGNYPDALDELEEYRTRFGDDPTHRALRARALAWQGKTKPALELSAQQLAETPQDIDALTTQTIALQAANRPREALANLQIIQQLRPDSRETADLARYLKTPQRSSVTAYINYGKDSDQVHTGQTGLEGEYVLSPETRLRAGTDGQKLKADNGNGLDNINGSRDATYEGAWVGAAHRFSPMLAADMRIGGARSSGNNSILTYRGGLDIRASDDWWFRPEVERDFYATSPRALSLGIERESSRVLARWTPGTRYTVDGSAAYDSFSDGNYRWEANLAPRRAFWRTQNFNIDLGLSARWFGFHQDLPNGYYDPQRYQRYAVTAFTYWKVNDNNGVSLAISAGGYKDNTVRKFKAGGDMVVQGYFGIYDDWYLRVYLSLLNNVRQSSGAYQGGTLGAALTRRF